MNIAISARGLQYKAGGAKEYIREMAQRLPVLDRSNRYNIYYSSAPEIVGINEPNVKETVVAAPHRLVWDHYSLPRQMKKDRIDIALFFKGTIPFRCPCKSIVSVLDMVYFFPNLKASEFLDRQYMLRMIPYSVRRADAVVAISNNTRLDVLRLASGISADKISTIPMASGLQPSGPVDVRSKYKIGETPYIFLSSSLSPRKNIERAILALGLVKDKIPHQLIMTGGTAWGITKIGEAVKTAGLGDRFQAVGFVSENDLFHLYNEADMYLMPSLYEGFSITLLEAMQAGCPVAASNVSSHPEVIGDAGVLFDPYNVTDIAETIYKLATDSDLRAKLQKKGYARAAEFSWEKSAILMHQVIERTLTSHD